MGRIPNSIKISAIQSSSSSNFANLVNTSNDTAKSQFNQASQNNDFKET